MVFFQQECIVRRSIAPIRFIYTNNEVDRSNRSRLGKFERAEVAFVHVRRGDYITWLSAESPAVLSVNWYKLQMQRLREEVGIKQFLMCSDDISFCKQAFSDEVDVVFSDGDVLKDMEVMLDCSAGVLSASSLSWWVAYMIHGENDYGEFIAPK